MSIFKHIIKKELIYLENKISSLEKEIKQLNCSHNEYSFETFFGMDYSFCIKCNKILKYFNSYKELKEAK